MMIDDYSPSGKTFADVIVRIADEFERNASGEKRTKALPGGSIELEVNRVVRQAVLAPTPGDFMAENRADCAIRVDDVELGADFRAAFNRRPREVEQLGPIKRQLKPVVLPAGAMGVDAVMRLLDRRQQAREVEAIRLPVLDRGIGIENIDAADQFLDCAEAQFSHHLPRVFSHHEQVVHDVLRFAGEFLPQDRVLRCDADGARIEMALPHHDAAERDQGRGRETELFGPENRSDHHIAASLEAAIGLQHDAAAEIVEHERLMRFRDAEVPWQAGMFDARER